MVVQRKWLVLITTGYKPGAAWHYKAYEREQSVIDALPTLMLISKPRPLGGVYGLIQNLSRLGSSGTSDVALWPFVRYGLNFIM